nr:hypothetical protein BaRGS_026512 [Batillaria attramentaria]
MNKHAVSDERSVFHIDYDTFSSIEIPLSTVYTPFAVDYDPVDGRVYWTDFRTRDIRSALLNGSDIQQLCKEIGMVTMDSGHHKTIITVNVDAPGCITLDTMKGVMYWSDVGDVNKIESANYDGTGRRVLVNAALYVPNGLALDLANNRLYWVDSGNNTVESSDLNGNDHRVVYSRSYSHFFGLALHQDKLYITDWGINGVHTPFAVDYDPEDGRIYWTDYTALDIRSARLDGTANRQLWASYNINNRLYWVDAAFDRVESMELNGNNRRIVYSRPLSHFFGLALHQDKLYITDWGPSGYLTSTSYLLELTTDGQNLKNKGTARGKLNDIHIYSEDTRVQAQWKYVDWYRLSDSVILSVNGSDPVVTSPYKQNESNNNKDNTAAVAGGVTVAVLLAVIIIVIILVVFIIKRKRKQRAYFQFSS